MGGGKTMKKAALLYGIFAVAATLSAIGVRGSPRDLGKDPRGRETQPERVIIKFRLNTAAHERAGLLARNGHESVRVIPQLDLHAIRIPRGKTAAEVMARYENHPLVEFVELETFGEPTTTPDDPAFVNWQMPLQSLGAEAAWDITTGSLDVPIAILDTGLDRTHFEFADRVVTGYDFKDGDSDYSDPSGHGTLVAGVIGAGANNGVGIAGATWNSSLMILRTGFGFDAREAIVWAADNGARVVSMSFGGYIATSSWEATCQYAFDRGVVLVGAAGNDGVESPFYPAAYPTVLAVTGINGNDEPIGYNWGDWIDLSAPASAVLTTTRIATDPDGDGFTFSGGTSIAAPFVASAAGLVLSANPDLSTIQVMEILRSTADDIGDAGFDVLTGFGRVNFHAAVLAALDIEPAVDTTPPIAEVVAPLAGEVISGMTTVIVAASDDTRVTRVDLYCNSVFVSSDTVAPHEWAFDTTTLPDGPHVFHAVAHDAAGNSGESPPVQAMVDNSASCECPSDCSAPDASEVAEATCTDGLDNDCDGLTDCEDSDCQSDGACAGPVCNNDGVCSNGEDCDNCPGDCHPVPGASCGNGVCEAGNGEDCITCPDDCNGKLGGKPERRFCCGDSATGCDDARCTETGFACTIDSIDASCCGDGFCEGNEDTCSCADDCGPAPQSETVGSTCSDGLDNDCDGLADCDDSDCKGDLTCSGCDNDGVCEPGEDCASCPNDCQGKTKGRRTTRSGTSERFCCGNGILEDAEGDGSVCDGNP